MRGELEPPISKETRSYDELIDEIMEWNIDHTDILDVLRSEIEEERLAAWSRALEVGVRKGLTSPSGKMEESSLFPVFLDLYKFVIKLRPKLLTNPTMQSVKKMEKSDSLCCMHHLWYSGITKGERDQTVIEYLTLDIT